MTTRGRLGLIPGPYVVDTITVPEDNPWKSWIRCSGFDFFEDGETAAMCSVTGDVWIVSGINEDLKELKWRRFATGLFQPLGLKIVDGEVYVLGRDQITRLHDLNADGEADFYEVLITIFRQQPLPRILPQPVHGSGRKFLFHQGRQPARPRCRITAARSCE